MAFESSVVVGSGIAPLKKQLPINQTTHERHLRGTQVVVLNPEDGSAGGSGLVTALSVGGTAVKLPTTPMRGRRAIAVFNNSAATLYVGFSPNVTTGTGWPVPQGTSLPMDINSDVELYGIAGSTLDVRILELS